jgi:hypothetical protein
VAADEDQVAATERSIGALDPSYRAFLKYANGWRDFLQNIFLFGTAQLLGAPPIKAALEAIAAVNDDDLSEQVGFNLAEMLPIGASESQTDLWLIGKPATKVTPSSSASSRIQPDPFRNQVRARYRPTLFDEGRHLQGHGIASRRRDDLHRERSPGR